MTTPETDLLRDFKAAQDKLVLQSSDLSLRTIANMVESGAIDLAPHFQRRDRWSASKQSALIESFMLNIPVPPIYLAEDELGTYSVIDGKQQISAIRAFLNERQPITNAVRFPAVEGMRFAELPRPMQHALDIRPLRAVTLLRQSDPELKYEVFHRLNTGGEILNAQEIRNVVNRGPLNDLVYELAENEFLRGQLKIRDHRSPAYRQMLDAEYVVRYLTLDTSWRAFSGDLSRSMDRFMEQYRDPSSRQLDVFAGKFSSAISFCEEIWGIHALSVQMGMDGEIKHLQECMTLR